MVSNDLLRTLTFYFAGESFPVYFLVTLCFPPPGGQAVNRPLGRDGGTLQRDLPAEPPNATGSGTR